MSAARYDDEEDYIEPWTLIEETYYLGHTYDKAIVSALRKLDPTVAPLWVVKTYDAPGHDDPQTFGRHVIARLMDQPRVSMRPEDFELMDLRGVHVPSPLPEELKGLTSGPYFVCEILEGPSPDGEQPGEYLPMTEELVERLRIAKWCLANHRIDDLARNRQRAFIKAKNAPKEEWKRQMAARIHSERAARKSRRGELVRISPVGQTRVEMSSQLMRLRKISAGEEA